MSGADRLDRFRLARADGVGPVAWRRLMARYGSAGAAITALPALARAGGRAAAPAMPSREAAARELRLLESNGAHLLLLDEASYPPLLARLDDAPPALAVLGDPGVLTRRAVAVVGGRNASANGRRIAETIAGELSEAGLLVVSGMARGVDAAAHEGALRGRGGTVAAVAGGLDMPYPPEHAKLQARIQVAGAVVAEAPLGTAPQARHFPRRNRIIAGLALGVVVVEAAPRSGSLITARRALEAGREVFAVPGSPLDARCRGSNDLIRQGARLTESAADVMADLPLTLNQETVAAGGMHEPGEAWGAPPVSEAALDRLRREVVGLLGPSPTAVDDLVRRCQVSPASVVAVLLELELAGRIESLPGNRVALIAE